MKKFLLFWVCALAVMSGQADDTANADRLAPVRQIAALSEEALVRQALVDNNVITQAADKSQYVDIVISADNDVANVAEQLEGIDLTPGTQAAGMVTVRVPLSKLNDIAALSGVRSVQVARPVFPMLDAVRAATLADSVQAGTGLPMAYTGKGVILGFIDLGFQYNHSAFLDFNTKESRITRIWEQKCDSLPEFYPDGFSYGCEFAPGKAEIVRNYDVTTSSHGTHVAGIATGADKRFSNPYVGLATEAEIVLVSTKSTDLTIIDGVNYIFNYAKSQGKPCVVNISLGTNLGPHDGTSYADRMLDALQGEGCLIVGAAGNSTGDGVHVGKKFSVRDNTLNTGLQFNSYGKTQYGIVDAWGTEGKKVKARVYLYDKTANAELAELDSIDFSATETKTFTYHGLPSGTSDSITVYISTLTGIDEANSKPNMYLQVVCSNIDRKKIFLGIEVQCASGEVNMWNDGSYSTFSNFGHPEYVSGDDDYGVCELGGTGKRIISVGAFTSKNSYTSLGGTEHNYTTYTVGDITSYSGHGPTVDGRVKPEVTAPGQVVVSAYNRYYASFSASNMVNSISYDGLTSYFGAMSGTSMASPCVAGVMALWLQADPTLTPERAKEIIRQSATNDSFTGDVRELGDPVWGYGKINALEGLRVCLSSGVDDIAASPLSAMRCSATGGQLSVALAGASGKGRIVVTDLLGRTLAETALAGSESAQVVSFSGMPQGMLLVTLSGPQGSQSVKVLSK